MFRSFFKELFFRYKQPVLDEVVQINGFMKTLMKQRNTGTEWTKYELSKIKLHLKRISKIFPLFLVFLLPGGLLLLALFAFILDRRKRKRHSNNKS